MPVREELTKGHKAVSLLPVGSGYAELSAGVSMGWGKEADPFVRLEAGHRLATNLTAFGFGQADRVGVQAGAGLRLTW